MRRIAALSLAAVFAAASGLVGCDEDVDRSAPATSPDVVVPSGELKASESPKLSERAAESAAVEGGAKPAGLAAGLPIPLPADTQQVSRFPGRSWPLFDLAQEAASSPCVEQVLRDAEGVYQIQLERGEPVTVLAGSVDRPAFVACVGDVIDGLTGETAKLEIRGATTIVTTPTRTTHLVFAKNRVIWHDDRELAEAVASANGAGNAVFAPIVTQVEPGALMTMYTRRDLSGKLTGVPSRGGGITFSAEGEAVLTFLFADAAEAEKAEAGLRRYLWDARLDAALRTALASASSRVEGSRLVAKIPVEVLSAPEVATLLKEPLDG